VITTLTLENKLHRETAARHCAEQLLEEKSRELYKINQELLLRNQKIAQQRKRLRTKVIELEETRQQLSQSEKMAVIGQLTAGVAHEINNPVAFIASNLDTLSDYLIDVIELINKQKTCLMKLKFDHVNNTASANNLLDDLSNFSHRIDVDCLLNDAKNLVSESVDGTHRVKKIVADLSDFSYVNAPNARAEDINDLLKKSVNIASSELKYKADMEWCLSEIPLVICHEGKIGQVFLNLLVNAAHAINERGSIRLSTGQEGQSVWVEFADSGCGISTDNLANIFDPFFTTKDIGKGTGLGLHVVKTAVEMHGGEISVNSKEGCGSIFKIILPIAGVTR
jgi:signal transduction histidine kinase|tara:strand:+ start:981 stop:1994 length:1014 start_codon:yes stop_codon:yes gene_type:complete